jgi:uncharacterized protein
MSGPVRITRQTARRFLLRSFLLDRPQAAGDLPTVLRALEFVQMDSINVCGRIHDLVLRARLAGYVPERLDAALYGWPRGAFEEYFPNLSVLPIEEYRYFVRRMRARARAAGAGRSERLTGEERAVAASLLERITCGGPLRARDAAAETGRTLSAWGTPQSVAARVLDKLWLHGVLAVHGRSNFERRFDLAERVLPEEAAALHRPGARLPSPREEAAFHARKRLRARRLFRPSGADRSTLSPAAFLPVEIEGVDRSWYVLADDLPRLEAAAEAAPPPPEVTLLAPLDPLVYDRVRTRSVLGFDYAWEVYTPAARRRWGYYVLPVLRGDRLVGRLDPVVDRAERVLRIRSLHLEDGVPPGEVAPGLAVALHEYSRFLGAERVRLEHAGQDLRRALAPALADLLETG